MSGRRKSEEKEILGNSVTIFRRIVPCKHAASLCLGVEIHPLQKASDELLHLVVLGEPYSIPTATEGVGDACLNLCVELHKLSDSHPLVQETWIDSFIGFEIHSDESGICLIDGTIIHGDVQRDMGFRVERDSKGEFTIDFFPPTHRCRRFMFRFIPFGKVD